MSFEPTACPNPTCVHARPAGSPGREDRFYRRKGSFRRSGDRRVARFQCRHCGKHFSEQTFSPDYREKKPEITVLVERLAGEGHGARSTARLLGVNRKTVTRRLRRLRARRPRPVRT